MVLLTAACAAPPAEEPPLSGARIGGPFALISETGATVRDSDFDGQYRLIYFGYAFCPDACPQDVAVLMRGFAAFEKADPAKAAKVQPLFVSVDPERDTLAVLNSFTDAFHPRLIGLTGDAAALEPVKQAYGVVATRTESRSGTAYDIDHSRQAYLMGPKGEPLALIPRDGSPDAIAAELARWVK